MLKVINDKVASNKLMLRCNLKERKGDAPSAGEIDEKDCR